MFEKPGKIGTWTNIIFGITKLTCHLLMRLNLEGELLKWTSWFFFFFSCFASLSLSSFLDLFSCFFIFFILICCFASWSSLLGLLLNLHWVVIGNLESLESCLNLFTWREDYDNSSRVKRNISLTINILQYKHTNIFLNAYDLWFIEEYVKCWHWLNINWKYCQKITPKVGNIKISFFRNELNHLFSDTGSLNLSRHDNCNISTTNHHH